MKKIEIYSKHFCPYCVSAKALLESKGVSYTEYEVSFDPVRQREMQQRANRRTVPQIFIDGIHVGGSDDLAALERSGELDQILAAEAA